MCSQQQSTRQVYWQLFASHNLSMHTCRHTLYASHICGCTPCHRCELIVRVLSLHDRTHACVLAPLTSASSLVSVRNRRHRALSISFVPLSLSLLCPSLSVYFVSLGRTLVLKMTENHFYGLKSTPSAYQVDTSVPRCVALPEARLRCRAGERSSDKADRDCLKSLLAGSCLLAISLLRLIAIS
jgi:hypothetical protein